MNLTSMRGAAALALIAFAATTHAEVLIDNLDQPVHNPAPLHNDFWYAQSFITASGDAMRLDLVSVRVGMMVGTPAVVAELRADNAGAPGALLTGFTLPPFSAGPTQNEALLPMDTVTLAPASTYWLLMGVNGAGGIDWSYAEGNAASGSGAFAEYTYTETQGATWIGFGTEDPMMMRVDVTALPVPEPAAAWMMAAALAIGCCARRRLQR